MNSDKQPIRAGIWGTSNWELYIADRLPDDAVITAVGCVAIVDLTSQKVAMTRNVRSQQTWEMPAGHIEPGERPLEALSREVSEEAGFVINSAQMFGYRKIFRPAEVDLTALTARERSYPNPGYLPYYYAYTEQERTAFSGEEISETRDFTLVELRSIAMQNTVNNDELAIIQLGLSAALENMRFN